MRSLACNDMLRCILSISLQAKDLILLQHYLILEMGLAPAVDLILCQIPLMIRLALVYLLQVYLYFIPTGWKSYFCAFKAEGVLSFLLTQTSQPSLLQSLFVFFHHLAQME